MHLVEGNRKVGLQWLKPMGVYFAHITKNSRGKPLSVLIQVISDQTPNLCTLLLLQT